MGRTELADGIDDVVERYEQAHAQSGSAEPDDFLPPTGDPRRAAVLGELLRVDLEYRWRRGSPRPLEDYLARYPDLGPDGLEGLAFEEYRQRRRRGDSPSPDDYRRRYGCRAEGWPTDPPADGLGRAAQSYRQWTNTRVVGDRVEKWNDGWDGPPEPADLIRDLHLHAPSVAQRFCEGVCSMPRVGQLLFGFDLIAELGSGAFGKVFLARQPELAGRLVALKVTADVSGEAQALAQLQHTNVVPLYSAHRGGALHAVCMPYFGSTTLADVLLQIAANRTLPASGRSLWQTVHARRSRTLADVSSRLATGEYLERADDAPAPLPPDVLALEAGPGLAALADMTYPRSVLWMAAQLAGALAHAHRRGILHRDVKPANVLLADDGTPMLLDFNLSADVKAPAGTAAMGGTLPYMAPEQLEALAGEERTVDGRADVYSLGVVLYELLTGLPAFRHRSGWSPDLLMEMARARGGPPPYLRKRNPQVSPATEAIVRRCLEPDPARRYPSAEQLEEDLTRHLADLPLKHTREPSRRERLAKWTRRNPRLASPMALAALAAALLLLASAGGTWLSLAARERRQDDFRRDSAARYESFREGVAEAERLLCSDEHEFAVKGDDLARRLLGDYDALSDPDWADRPHVAALPPEDRARLRREVGELAFLTSRADLRGRDPADREALDRLADGADAGERGRFLRASELTSQGRYRDALALLAGLLRDDPADFGSWLLRGRCLESLGEVEEALSCYGTCVVLRPNLALPYVLRGNLAFRHNKSLPQAAADFDVALRLQPERRSTWVERALVRHALTQDKEALSDLDKAAELGPLPPRVEFIRARVLSRLKRDDEAKRARAAGLASTPKDAADYLARGVARITAKDAAGALADFRQAEVCEPRNPHALVNQAYVLGEVRHEHAEALAVLDRLLKFRPQDVTARGGRAVLLARLGRTKEAVDEARWCESASSHPENLYRVACIYSLASEKNPELSAHGKRLLAVALLSGWGFDHVEADPDLTPLRKTAGFNDVTKAVKTLRGWRDRR